MKPRSETFAGVSFALLAYGSWGFAPIYWKALAQVPPLEILSHRVIWALLLTAALLSIGRGWSGVADALRQHRTMRRLLLSSLLIGINWLTFIWAVNNGQVLATSLGYFLAPLLSVALGIWLLDEKLSRWQLVAVGLAATALVAQALQLGSLPWISLVLASSFSLYGLLRKVAPVGSLPGLASETLILSPFALVYAFLIESDGRGVFANLDSSGVGTALLLMGGGLVTAAPLLWFAGAARRLPLSTVGLFQYIAPSVSFVLAIALYDEPFTRAHALSFGCIWVALLLYSWESLRGSASSGS